MISNQVIAGELPIFLREHFNGMYRTDVYFLSKTFADLPIYILFPFFFVTIPYFAIGLNSDPGAFFTAVIIVILVANVATSFGRWFCFPIWYWIPTTVFNTLLFHHIGYFTSCIASSTQVALAMSAPLIIPMLLFGGFFLKNGSVPIYFDWLRYISWFMYGNEALSINQWSGIMFNDPLCPGGVCTQQVILDQFDFAAVRNNCNNFNVQTIYWWSIIFRFLEQLLQGYILSCRPDHWIPCAGILSPTQ